MSAPTRPLLRWHGGKWLMAPWIIDRFPAHQCYVEPFGGAASVLLRKPRSYSEVYNDLDQILVGLFRVLRDDVQAAALTRALELTPFARAEFEAAYEHTDDPVEAARRTIVRSFMGFGSDSTAGHYRTGFRCNTTRMGTTPARDWSNFVPALRDVCERIRPTDGSPGGVTIESRPAIEVMLRYDAPATLHYCDPPYLSSTRSAGNRRRCGPGTEAWHVYRHELSDVEHADLLATIVGLTGMVAISGYASELYDDTLAGWTRHTRDTYADGASPRTEVLWLNAAMVDAIGHGPLFA